MLRHHQRIARSVDVAVSGLALLVFAPVIAVIALVVRLRLGSPVLFRQDRVGRDEQVFRLVKFRTMRVPDADHITDADRLTRVGRWLRATSLDELPTLWNVFRGEMSLVGPRPLLVEYLPLYSPVQARRHEVRPGITGLAQISGRNALTWEEKFAYDVDYVDNRTHLMDLRILGRTISAVVTRRGAVEVCHGPFRGSTEPGRDRAD
ncbi:sugar transferase [Nostocoides vanveenii]|uniref:sugar transferase n=1 Tax=Nostocoides vanveenii TaxID=330835 RepID=UPI0031E2F2CB